MLTIREIATTLKMRMTIIIIAVVSTMVFAEFLTAQEPSPDFYLNNYQDLLDSFAVVSFSVSCSDYNESNTTNVNTYQLDWIIDFTKRQYYQKHIYEDNHDMFDIDIFNQSQTMSLTYNPNGASDVDKYLLTSYCTLPIWNETIPMLYESFAFGYFKNGRVMTSIPETLRHAKNQILFKDGKPCLNSITGDFEINIIFNQEKDFCPDNIHIRRLNPSVSPQFSDLYEYNTTEHINVNGKWFPCKFKVTESRPGGHYEYNIPPGVSFGGKTGKDVLPRKLVAEIELSDIKILDKIPEEYFKFPIKIPNGISVSMQDAPQIEYIWMDGKIVPKTDERMLAIARGGHKFIPGPKEPRFWLILLGIVGILVGGGWKLYDFWTSDRETASPKPDDQAT